LKIHFTQVDLRHMVSKDQSSDLIFFLPMCQVGVNGRLENDKLFSFTVSNNCV